MAFGKRGRGGVFCKRNGTLGIRAVAFLKINDKLKQLSIVLPEDHILVFRLLLML
jgi:hypothetical protein